MKILATIYLLVFLVLNVFCQQDVLTVDLNDTIRLKLIKEDFNKENRRIDFWDSTQQTISSIDNKPIYGTDASLPLTELTFAELQINNQKIRLETGGMFDPWGKDNRIVRYELKQFLGNPLKIRCLFSLGAGTYFVEWTIIGDKSFRTMITQDRKILDVVKFKN